MRWAWLRKLFCRHDTVRITKFENGSHREVCVICGLVLLKENPHG